MGLASQSNRLFSVKLLAIVAVILGTLGCEDRTAVGFPEIHYEPKSIVFPAVRINEESTKRVTVKNPGGKELRLTNIRLVDGSSNGELELLMTDGAGDQITPPDSIIIAGQEAETVVFEVRYRPNDERPDYGELKFSTNTEDSAGVTIPIKTQDAVAQINVNPRSVDFGRVAAGDEQCQPVTVTNVGTIPLDIHSIVVSGSLDFLPLMGQIDPRRDSEILADPDGDDEPGLAPGESVELTICYAPPSEGPDFGELSIFSSDENTQEFKIPLIANGSTACIDVNPATVEFPMSLVLRSDSRPLNIESCGSQPLEIVDVWIEGEDAFGINMGQMQESLGELPATLPAVTPGTARPNRSIRIEFKPEEERIYNGKLLIASNDPFAPAHEPHEHVREVPLLGRGVVNACPQPRVAQDEFFVLPLDVVVLDGSASIDSDGPNNQPIEYVWEVISRPEGSRAHPMESLHDNGNPELGGVADDTATPRSVFWVDLAGSYTIQLNVVDNLGLDSRACSRPALVQVIAIPDQDVHVQLVWRTPADPDETDSDGTDLDLHVMRPGIGDFHESWFSIPDDCYFENVDPDWGQPSSPTDDPEIDIDDINGGGPENINLNKPEMTSNFDYGYVVGVHYYCDRGRFSREEYGPTFSNLRIYLKGELAWDYSAQNGEDKELATRGTFWEAASVAWPSLEVTPVDTVYDSGRWCGSE